MLAGFPLDRIDVGAARAVGVVVHAVDEQKHISERLGEARLLQNGRQAGLDSVKTVIVVETVKADATMRTVKRAATTKHVAEALGLKPTTVQLYCREGRIPFAMTPGGHRRFDIDEVRAALASTSKLRSLAQRVGLGTGAPVTRSVGDRMDEERRAIFGEATVVSDAPVPEPALEHLVSHSTTMIFASA